MSKLAAKLRKLTTDCRPCRHGFCCGQCLCCIPEEALRALVQEAQGEAAKCLIPAMTLPPCDLEWGHDGDMHANGGDGFYAEQYLEEHRRRQIERKRALP